MATKRPSKKRIDTLLQEAADPSTDPERLRELVDHEDEAVYPALLRNPSLPEDVWRAAWLHGWPEAWANPMAPFYALTWTPRESDSSTLEQAARWVTQTLWIEPERCSLEGKALINAKVQEGWPTCESTSDMMSHLGGWVRMKGDNSPEHREVVRIVVLCVRTTPNLTPKDRQALDLLEAWSEGGEDLHNEAKFLTSSLAVVEACWFVQDPRNSPWKAIYEVLEAVEQTSGTQAKTEHERLLADLIRGEMPLPPVVE